MVERLAPTGILIAHAQKNSKKIFLLMLVESLPVGIFGGMFGGIQGGIGGPPGAFVVSPTHLNFKHVRQSLFENQCL